eukprot:PhM_4_TR14081/c0_g1_i1/m.106977
MRKEDSSPTIESKAQQPQQQNMPHSKLWYYLFHSTIQPKDDFVVTTRKLICVVFFLTLIPIGFAAAIAFNSVNNGSLTLTEGYIRFIVSMAFIFVSTASWIRLKRTHEIHLKLLAMTLFLLFANFFVLHLTNPEVDANITMMSVFVAAMLMNLYVRFFFSIVLCAFGLNMYNFVIGREHGSYIAIRTDGMEQSLYSRSMNMFTFSFVYILTCLLIHRLFVECNLLLRRNQRALQITQSLGEALVSYDTERARVALCEYREDEHHHDADLSSVFGQIIDNLDVYRPFLPNFLLMSSENDEVDRGSQDSDGETTVTSAAAVRTLGVVSEFESSPTPPPPSAAENINNNNNNSNDDVMPVFFSSTNPVGAISEVDTVVNPLVNIRSRFTTSGGAGQSSSNEVNADIPMCRAAADSSSSSSSRPSSSLLEKERIISSLTRRITMGLLHAPFFMVPSLQTTETTSSFVDKLHTIADRSVAVIHSYFGDHIVVSWNTARRAAQHEVKAAGFLVRCRAEAPWCVGAIMSGPAVFALCGMRQVIPVLKPQGTTMNSNTNNNNNNTESSNSSPTNTMPTTPLTTTTENGSGAGWMRRLEYLLYHLAVPLGVNVCDEAVVFNISHTFRCRAFAAYATSASDITRCRLAYEIVGERSAAGDDEEWMYAMQQEAATDADDSCRH